MNAQDETDTIMICAALPICIGAAAICIFPEYMLYIVFATPISSIAAGLIASTIWNRK